MVYSAAGNFWFGFLPNITNTRNRRDQLMNWASTRFSGLPEQYGPPLIYGFERPSADAARAGGPGCRIDVLFTTRAARDQFVTDVIAAINSSGWTPLLGSSVYTRDSTVDVPGSDDNAPVTVVQSWT